MYHDALFGEHEAFALLSSSAPSVPHFFPPIYVATGRRVLVRRAFLMDEWLAGEHDTAVLRCNRYTAVVYNTGKLAVCPWSGIIQSLKTDRELGQYVASCDFYDKLRHVSDTEDF